MSLPTDVLQALDRLGHLDTLIAMGFGLVTCLLGPLVHELGHLAPARLFCGAGRMSFFPYRDLGGWKAWIVVFAIDIPDERFHGLSAGKAGIVLSGGPIADLLFSACCALVWHLFPSSIGVGIAVGGAARAAVWLLNVIPIPALGNDGARFVERVLRRRFDAAPMDGSWR